MAAQNDQCPRVFVYSPDLVCARIERQRGISLIELILFIVIVGIALAGVALVMNRAPDSAKPVLRKQAYAVAESLLEEAQAQAVSGTNPCPTATANAVRTGFNKVCDYNGYTTTNGMLDMTGAAVSGLAGFNISPAMQVTWTTAAWAGIPAGSAVTIAVYVTDPLGNTYNATGYRAAY